MDELIEYIKGLPWKDMTAPIIAGLFAMLAGALAMFNKRQEKRQDKHDADEKDQRDRVRVLETTQTEDLTNRLRILMEGYENRIRELSAELIAVKDELREAREHGRNTTRRT